MKIEFLFTILLVIPATVLAEGERFKIGASLALSGRYAFVGESERDGLTLAVEEVNRNGGVNGIPIDLLVEDNAGEPKAAASGANKLLRTDRVDLFFSAFTHITRAVQPIVSGAGVLMVYASSMRDIASQNEFVFRDYVDMIEDGSAVARLLKQRGHKRIGYMKDESEPCTIQEVSLRENLSRAAIEIVHNEEYTSGENDLKPALLRLYAAEGMDAVVFCAWRDTDLVVRQSKALGLLNRKPTYHVIAPFLPVSDTPEIRALFEQAGAVSTWYGFLETSSSSVQREFIQTFRDRYGRFPRPDSAFAYDDIMILVKALLACRSKPGAPDKMCLSKALLSMEHHGAAGTLRFDKDRVSVRPSLLMQVKNGEWVEVTLK